MLRGMIAELWINSHKQNLSSKKLIAEIEYVSVSIKSLEF